MLVAHWLKVTDLYAWQPLIITHNYVYIWAETMDIYTHEKLESIFRKITLNLEKILSDQRKIQYSSNNKH